MLFQTEKEYSSALLELILKRNKKEIVTPFVSHYRCIFLADLKYGKGIVPIIVNRVFNQSLWTQRDAKAKFFIANRPTTEKKLMSDL